MTDPSIRSDVKMDAHDFVGSQEAVFDALSQRISVDRVAEVADIGDVLGLFGGCGQADLGGAFKVFQDLPPG